MPYLPEDDGDTIFLRSPLGGPVEQPPTPNLRDTIAAGFRAQNTVVNAVTMFGQKPSEPVEGYNPFNDIKGTPFEEYGARFAFSDSPIETSQIKTRIEEENAAKRTLAASGMFGTGAQLMAGLIDPAVLLPAGTIYKGIRSGAALGRTALSTGVAGGLQAALQEGVLQTTQSTRLPSEGAVNIASGALLSALLGGAVGTFASKAEREALVGQIDNLRTDLATPSRAAGAEETAQRNLTPTPYLPGIITRPLNAVGRAAKNVVSKVPYVGPAVARVGEKVAGIPEYLATKSGPMLRILNAPSDGSLGEITSAARKGMVDIAEVPLRLQAHTEGQTTTDFVPLQREIRNFVNRAEITLTQRAEQLFREFRFGTNNVKFAKFKAAMGKRFGQEGMTFDKFMEEVDYALRHGDKHDIPQVQSLAQDFRKVIDTPKEKAIKLELLEDKPPLGAESYAPRRVIRDKLIAQKPLFLDNYVQWRRTDQAGKKRIQEQLALHHEALTGVEQNLGKLSKKLEVKEAAAEAVSNREQEVSRLNEFAYKRSEKLSEPLDALRDRIRVVQDQASSGLGHLDELAAAIKAEKENFPEIKEADQAIYRLIEASSKIKEGKTIVDQIDALAEFTDTLDEVRGGINQAIKAAKGEAQAARLQSGADDLIELEKIKSALNKELAPYKRVLAKLRKELAQQQERRGPLARGGAVFETRIRNRGNTLSDQLSGRESEIEAIKKDIEKHVTQQAEFRGRIEELLGQWEGKTAKEAKAILEKRSQAETERAVKQYMKSEPKDNARLTSADDTVDKAVKEILESDQRKSDSELGDEAEQTYNQYIGTPDGRLPKDDPHYGAMIPKADQGRGPLIARRNPMLDDLLLPFLDRNPLNYTKHYLRTMMSDIGMYERTGDFEGTIVKQAIQEAAARASKLAKTDAERSKIQKHADALISDYAGIRDRTKGVFGFSAHQTLRKAGEISQMLGDFDVTTNLGGSGIAQIPDFANIVARYAFSGGLAPAFKSLTGYLSRTSDTFKKAKAEYGPYIAAFEMMLQSRGHDLADIGDVYQPATKFARILRTGAEATMVLSGTALMTDVERVGAAIAASTSFLKAARAVAGGRASQKQIMTLAEANISSGMAKRIWESFSGEKGGEITKEGAYLTNTANWTDGEARKFFEAAIGRDVDIAVATPGEEKPLFLSTPGLALIGKYKSFVAAANTRILLANLQRRDASTLSGFIAAVGLGMLVSSIRSELSGIDVSQRRPQDWIKEGMDRSGMMGWIGEFNAMAAQATGNSMDLYRLIGADRPLSRYSSRSILGSMTGPIGGKIEAMGQIGSAAGSGNWSAADVHKLRQLIPLQNLFYLRGLIDQMETGANQTFGIPQKVH